MKDQEAIFKIRNSLVVCFNGIQTTKEVSLTVPLRVNSFYRPTVKCKSTLIKPLAGSQDLDWTTITKQIKEKEVVL